jgi:hypothetical protein
MIPLIYFDKTSNKTVIKLEASSRDERKASLVKQLHIIRNQRNKVARVLEKVLSMFDVVNKERFEY